jgi:hypothetical protein
MSQHETIWLQPWCDNCDRNVCNGGDGRMWCQDNVWDPCECGAKPVRYIIDGRSKRRTPQVPEVAND